MRIYTKTGDKGETSLLGGVRVSKHSLAVVAIGEVDELNASIGVVISQLENQAFLAKQYLIDIQHHLFVIGAILASCDTDAISVPQLSETDILKLETWIDAMDGSLPQLTQFILPGGKLSASHVFLARTICRRAERSVVALSSEYVVPREVLQYLNRLSDALFVCGRWVNSQSGITDVPWEKPEKVQD